MIQSPLLFSVEENNIYVMGKGKWGNGVHRGLKRDEQGRKRARDRELETDDVFNVYMNLCMGVSDC